MTNYFVYDVFTDTAFGGNQLAVIPDASTLPEADLQSIAAEFNFSETTFVYPPADPAHTASVRIFTPTRELRFAGHPTIGTAIALHDLGRGSTMVLELGVGPVPVNIHDDGAAFVVSNPLERISTPKPELVAAALGLPLTAICTDTHPPLQISIGLPFVIVELASKADLARCGPVIDQIRIANARYPSDSSFALYPYVRDAGKIEARMFAPLDNVPEDPATGSAAATLAALLTELLGQDQELAIAQGIKMGRPSFIQASTTAGESVAVTISGTARRTMEGRLVYRPVTQTDPRL